MESGGVNREGVGAMRAQSHEIAVIGRTSNQQSVLSIQPGNFQFSEQLLPIRKSRFLILGSLLQR
jgi:hypothetical protein